MASDTRSHGIEESEHFVVRIEWDSIDGHEHRFRASPASGVLRRRAAVLSEIGEMKHYEVQHSGG